MKTNRLLLLGLLTAVFFIHSCSSDADDNYDDDDNPNPTNESTVGIRHDRDLAEYEDLAANPTSNMPNFSSVVSFSYSLDGSDNYDFVATGTLISPNWILTAAHNFYDAQEQNSPAPVSGVWVDFGNDPNNPDASRTVAEIVLHPTWLAGDQDFSYANDLCLVRLSSPITNVTPATLHTSSNETIGNVVWHCGFGDYSGIPGQNPNLISKKHAIQNTLDRKQSGLQSSAGGTTYTGGLLAFDFDNPSGTRNTLGDTVVNDDEALLGNGSSSSSALNYEGSTIGGDSGGPLFINHNGNWEVIGVLSGGASEPFTNHVDGDYGDISIYIRVATSYNWIQSVIN